MILQEVQADLAPREKTKTKIERCIYSRYAFLLSYQLIFHTIRNGANKNKGEGCKKSTPGKNDDN